MRRQTCAALVALTLLGCGGSITNARNLGPLGDNSCEAYLERARGHAYDSHLHDWDPLAKVLRSPVDPAADVVEARKRLRDLGVPILYLDPGRSGKALYWTVVLPKTFESWTQGKEGDDLRLALERQSRLLWHEYQHIVWERRLGALRSGVVYLDESGTLAVEANANVVTFAFARRYGWSEERIAAEKRRRWAAFPGLYAVSHAIDSACVARHMEWTEDKFRIWARKNGVET